MASKRTLKYGQWPIPTHPMLNPAPELTAADVGVSTAHLTPGVSDDDEHIHTQTKLSKKGNTG